MRLFFIAVLVGLCGLAAVAQDTVTNVDSTQLDNRAAVVLNNDTLFYLYGELDGISAKERADLANRRIENIIHSENFTADSFKVFDFVDYSRIVYSGQRVANITYTDAYWYGKPVPQAAKDYVELLRVECSSYRSTFNIREIVKQILLALVILIISAFIIRYVNRLFKLIGTRIQRLKGTRITALKMGTYEVMDEDRFTSLILLVSNIVRILFLLLIFYLTLPVVLRIFPWTQGVADMLFGFILNPLKAILASVVEYIPNLFTIAVIFIVIRYLAKGISYLANEIKTEKLRISGFYPDWAVPTSRIVNFILYAFMLVLIWPYLPGSGSAVFQGVSVFLGLLISLGSSSAISNIVAGLVITYMRPFRVGDRVKMGDVMGDVVEKNLLVTRVRTIKNEFITVPNSQILAGSSINYSTSSAESSGLVIHSTVTIGYDVPWRKVHAMLKEAAVKTPCIEENPAPFVLQTSLDDFYISYQINAYTKAPAKQAMIYSDLHALIQDVFAKNDVEIMSPHYRAEREGPSTIPPINGKGNTEGSSGN
jgi:small-conductance mechanosensitive channel